MAVPFRRRILACDPARLGRRLHFLFERTHFALAFERRPVLEVQLHEAPALDGLLAVFNMIRGQRLQYFNGKGGGGPSLVGINTQGMGRTNAFADGTDTGEIRTPRQNVILSEAKNLGSNLERSTNKNRPRCSASLNMTVPM